MIRLSKFVFILSWEVYDVEIGKVTSMSTELLRPHQGSPLQVAGQLKGSVEYFRRKLMTAPPGMGFQTRLDRNLLCE